MEDRIPIERLFEVRYGTKFDLNKMSEAHECDPEGIAFVSRTRENLGVSAYVRPYENTPPFPSGLITVSLGGSYLLTAFVQERQFYTAQNVAVLTPKASMNFIAKVFYCLCLSKNRFRYSAFGREANRTLAKIKVPATVPDSFLSNRVDNTLPNADPIISGSVSIEPLNWKEFRLADLFVISGTRTTPAKRLAGYGEGSNPYVTTRATNNGVAGFYDFHTERGGVLVVDSAVLGHCTYQEDAFSASDHVEKLTPRFELNQYIAMFLTTIINFSQFRYSYGRKASQSRLRRAKLRLPSGPDGTPDWKYMETFIKSLPYSGNL